MNQHPLSSKLLSHLALHHAPSDLPVQLDWSHHLSGLRGRYTVQQDYFLFWYWGGGKNLCKPGGVPDITKNQADQCVLVFALHRSIESGSGQGPTNEPYLVQLLTQWTLFVGPFSGNETIFTYTHYIGLSPLWVLSLIMYNSCIDTYCFIYTVYLAWVEWVAVLVAAIIVEYRVCAAVYIYGGNTLIKNIQCDLNRTNWKAPYNSVVSCRWKICYLTAVCIANTVMYLCNIVGIFQHACTYAQEVLNTASGG